MTLLGKVFTLMVLVLSVIFFTLSVAVNATHINYRDENAKLKDQQKLEQAKSKELAELVEKEKDKLATEQLARRAALSSLQTQLEQLNSDVRAKEKELADKQSQLTQLANTENLTQQQLTARTNENVELRNLLKQAQEDRNSQYQNFVQTYDKYLRLQGEKKSLEDQARELGRKFDGAQEKLTILGITPDTPLDGAPPVNGVVSAVSNNLVEVSIGKDDGIRVGHKLDVYRGGQYIGRINITRSEDDKAIGEVMPSFSKGFILKGDRVDSRLNEIYVKRPSAQ
jgi:hypothetical protein